MKGVVITNLNEIKRIITSLLSYRYAELTAGSDIVAVMPTSPYAGTRCEAVRGFTSCPEFLGTLRNINETEGTTCHFTF